MINGGVPEEKPKELTASAPSVIHKGWKIPLLPVSMNKLYAINYRTKQVYMTPEARNWKTKAKMFISSFVIEKDFFYDVIIEINTALFCKNGNLKRFDAHNLTKIVADTLSERLGVDDSVFKKTTIEKNNSLDNFLWLSITKGDSFEKVRL
jgi:Holliday junction resolvase RusA-like endonuclease